MAKSWAIQFYKSKQWRATREYVLRRDMYTCKDCWARGNEVHHIIPLDENNINDPSISLNPDNLVTVCSLCHKKITLGKGDIADGYVFDSNGQVIKI
jgi:5-methylcytosine-specific restriction endonuclease McrA